jgi:hypothetical protein
MPNSVVNGEWPKGLLWSQWVVGLVSHWVIRGQNLYHSQLSNLRFESWL